MGSYAAGARRRVREFLIAACEVIPVFVIVACLSNLGKALVASAVTWSIWIAISARKEGWQTSGFWWIVTLVGAINAVAIWAPPMEEPSKAGLPVAYPLGMAEGFGIYWLFGWWLQRSSNKWHPVWQLPNRVSLAWSDLFELVGSNALAIYRALL